MNKLRRRKQKGRKRALRRRLIVWVSDAGGDFTPRRFTCARHAMRFLNKTFGTIS